MLWDVIIINTQHDDAYVRSECYPSWVASVCIEKIIDPDMIHWAGHIITSEVFLPKCITWFNYEETPDKPNWKHSTK